MEEKKITAAEAVAGRDSDELKETELESISGGFNPQPDPPAADRR